MIDFFLYKLSIQLYKLANHLKFGITRMKIRFAALALLLLYFLVQVASAQWNALNSGYAVTTDYHGKNVPLGTVVTATAGTTNPKVKNVTFIWKCNETEQFRDENVPVWSNGTRWPDSGGGDLIYYAQSQHIVDVYGDWGVQAFFIGEDGTTKANVECTIRIRATSFFNVIPTAPVVGTAGVAIAMILSLGAFLKRKRS